MSDGASNDQAFHDSTEGQLDATPPMELAGEPEKPSEELNESRNQSDFVEIGDSLEGFECNEELTKIAATNHVTIPWNELQDILRKAILQQCEMIEKVITDPANLARTELIKTSILHSIDRHQGPPFTIQRLCELVTDPKKHYKMFIKYLNAVDKVLLVTTTWDRFPEGMTNGKVAHMESESVLTTNCVLELEPISSEQNDVDTPTENNDSSTTTNTSMDLD